MPPKAKPQAASKKTVEKKKEKIIEDKTFGLKNKKGAKNQKYIQQVQTQVKYGNQSAKKLEDQKKAEVTKKEEKKKEQQELNTLFKPVTNVQKVDKGVDPKSVLCAFFKQGQCGKGEKCKFSHNLDIEKKAEKKDIYTDMRDLDDSESGEEGEDSHRVEERRRLKTRGICKHFLEAVEKNKYGWFWECPNGGDKCQFRHALPEGYVLNRDKQKEEKKDEISIEELVEIERANLPFTLTKINLESFLEWKKRRVQGKKAAALQAEAHKKAEMKAGRSIGLSGRDMFTFRPEMAAEDQMEDGESALDTAHYSEEDDVDEDGTIVPKVKYSNVRELTLEDLALSARESDGTGTAAPAQRHNNHVHVEDETGAGIAGGGVEDEVPVDESLFAEDDEDLDELEENVDDLTISE